MDSQEIVYCGTVKNVPNGFGFIDIMTVRLTNGAPHGLETVNDIFVPQSECNVPLRVGLVLRFAVKPNEKKGSGHFMAVGATEVTETALMSVNGPVMPGFHWSLINREGTGIVLRHGGEPHPHDAMKAVPPEVVAKVVENQPMPDIPRDEQAVVIPDDPAGVEEMLSRYLYSQYPSLHAINMDYRITGYDNDALDVMVAKTAADYREMGMEEQAVLLEQEYASFKSTRRLLTWVIEKGFLHPGTKLSPAMLATIVKLVEETKNAAGRESTVEAVEKCTGFMLQHDLLRPSTVIPMYNLPELFMACPVWYHAVEGPGIRNVQQQISGPAGDGPSWTMEATKEAWKAADPQPHPSTKWFCDLFEDSPQWWDVFQMFNRRLRTLQRYKGDMIPPHILQVMRAARDTFDYVVIMTPYHDVAGRDWEDLSWLRSIDPYLVGFKRGLNVFFILGRFSDTGVFPLFNELVADTTMFLRENKVKLKGFNKVGGPYWYTPPKHEKKRVGGPLGCWPSNRHDNQQFDNRLGSHLIALTDRLLAAFEAGHLFDWLRGGWDLPVNLITDRATNPR